MSLEGFAQPDQEINIHDISVEKGKKSPELVFDPERDLGKEFWDTMQKIIRRYESNQQYLFAVEDLSFLSFISEEKSAAIINPDELKENAIIQFKTLKVKTAGGEKMIRQSDLRLFIKSAAAFKILHPNLTKDDLGLIVGDEQEIYKHWEDKVQEGFLYEEILFLRLWNSPLLSKISEEKDTFLEVNQGNADFELSQENYISYIGNLAAKRLVYPEEPRIEPAKIALDYYNEKMENLAKLLTAAEIFQFYIATAAEVKYGPNGLEIINNKKEEFGAKPQQMPVERNY